MQRERTGDTIGSWLVSLACALTLIIVQSFGVRCYSSTVHLVQNMAHQFIAWPDFASMGSHLTVLFELTNHRVEFIDCLPKPCPITPIPILRQVSHSALIIVTQQLLNFWRQKILVNRSSRSHQVADGIIFILVFLIGISDLSFRVNNNRLKEQKSAMD